MLFLARRHGDFHAHRHWRCAPATVLWANAANTAAAARWRFPSGPRSMPVPAAVVVDGAALAEERKVTEARAEDDGSRFYKTPVHKTALLGSSPALEVPGGASLSTGSGRRGRRSGARGEAQGHGLDGSPCYKTTRTSNTSKSIENYLKQ